MIVIIIWVKKEYQIITCAGLHNVHHQYFKTKTNAVRSWTLGTRTRNVFCIKMLWFNLLLVYLTSLNDYCYLIILSLMYTIRITRFQLLLIWTKTTSKEYYASFQQISALKFHLLYLYIWYYHLPWLFIQVREDFTLILPIPS